MLSSPRLLAGVSVGTVFKCCTKMLKLRPRSSVEIDLLDRRVRSSESPKMPVQRLGLHNCSLQDSQHIMEGNQKRLYSAR